MIECEDQEKLKKESQLARRRERDRKWRKNNPEKVLAYSRKHRAANREKLNERNRAWCKANLDKMRKIKKRWRKENPEKMDAYRRKVTGLPEPTRPRPEVCEICEKPSSGNRALCLDHNHETGKFRGWLCHMCNAAIGMLGDNIAGLELAIEYLNRSSEEDE